MVRMRTAIGAALLGAASACSGADETERAAEATPPAPVTEAAAPDLALDWTDGCAFGEVVPMGWERLRGEELNPGDPVKARTALATLPRLVVFRGDEPIYHSQGYGPGMEAAWPGGEEPAIAGAPLAALDAGADAGGALGAMADEPGLTFVQFGAEWCAPCKTQAVAITERQAAADGALRYVAIDADPQKWAGTARYPACEA